MTNDEKEKAVSQSYEAISDILDRHKLPRNTATIHALIDAYQKGVEFMYNEGIKDE